MVSPNQQYAQNMVQEYLGTDLMTVELPIDHMIPKIGDGISNYDSLGEILGHLLTNVPATGVTELLPPNEEPDNGW